MRRLCRQKNGARGACAQTGMKRDMTTLQGERFGQERALYHAQNIALKRCRFEGEEDGESALKEGRDIVAENCYMDLRYPFWHCRGLAVRGGEMTERCRAALWYDRGVVLEDCALNGIKALRECRGVQMRGCAVRSPEFGWRCRDVSVQDCGVESEYAFLESRGIRAEGLRFAGKYSFQYVRDVRIARSALRTKDAFWHAKNVTVTDSVLDGEYLGWYSERLTLIRCTIRGTQPLCYCRGLRLVDCTMEGCDLAFECSDVHADVRGSIDSVKNVRSGRVIADSIGEILCVDPVRPVRAKIVGRQGKGA